MIRHVALLKLIDPDDAAEACQRLEALAGQVPSLLTIEAGADVARTPASYDVSIVTTHADLAGLHDYDSHPVHQEFRAWLVPRLTSRVVVDSEH